MAQNSSGPKSVGSGLILLCIIHEDTKKAKTVLTLGKGGFSVNYFIEIIHSFFANTILYI